MIQTYVQYLCIKTAGKYVEGCLYYAHEDSPLDSDIFLMVVDDKDFPVTIYVRGEIDPNRITNPKRS